MAEKLTEEQALEAIREIHRRVIALRKKRLRVVRVPDKGNTAFTIKIIEVP